MATKRRMSHNSEDLLAKDAPQKSRFACIFSCPAPSQAADPQLRKEKKRTLSGPL